MTDTPDTQTSPDNTSSQAIPDTVANTHNALASHYDHSYKNKNAPTFEELKKDADFVQEQIKQLEKTISANTPKGQTAETMQQDHKDTHNAINALDNGKDPISTYEQQATVSTNSQSQTITHDTYTLEKNKNNSTIAYELTTRDTGGLATAMGDENAIIGASSETQAYSYRTQTSGKNTTIETHYTDKYNRTPDSANIAQGNNFTSQSEKEYTNKYVYDKDKRLTKSESNFSGNFSISSSVSTAHKGKDLSTKEETTSLKTSSNIYGNREYIRFDYLETDKNGNITESINGHLSQNERVHSDVPIAVESYEQHNGTQYISVSRDKDSKGNTTYSGITATITGPKNELPLASEQYTNIQHMSPKEAEKTYQKLQNKANKQIEKLTGKHSLQEYAQGVPEAPARHNLGAMFSNHNTPEAASTTKSNNEAFNNEYTNTPALALNTNANKQKQTTTLTTQELMLLKQKQLSH